MFYHCYSVFYLIIWQFLGYFVLFGPTKRQNISLGLKFNEKRERMRMWMQKYMDYLTHKSISRIAGVGQRHPINNLGFITPERLLKKKTFYVLRKGNFYLWAFLYIFYTLYWCGWWLYYCITFFKISNN